MAYLIEPSCINCDMCELECPNEAIFMGEEIYQINTARCTECVGHYDCPQCVEVCPIDCVILDPDNREDAETLLIKFATLTGLCDDSSTH